LHNKTTTPRQFDDAYLQIWKIEQEHSRTRWTVTTFFLSISFAVLGLSFDFKDNQIGLSVLGLSLPDAQRVIGLLIYWFGYILFVQFNRYTNFLRDRLKSMEKQKLVSYSFQSDAREFMYSRIRAAFSATWLLFYFGLLYTGIVAAIIIASLK
jgi:protein-S-isoprenylcysteine O-methyltransferase Ste14